jgi:3-oxoacyl-[acyl-carrier protein] reductase
LDLASSGADVVVHGRDRSATEEVRDSVRQAGVQSEAIVVDLTDAAQRRELVERAFLDRGVDVWVNNAGADVLTGPTASWSFEEKLSRLWEVDVVATVDLSRQVGQRMRARGKGVILNMSWDQAEYGMDGDSGEMFALIKGGIMSFSRSLAKSLAPEVRVNCLAPGWIRTAWGERASQAWQARAMNESLSGRWGTPEDVAAAARFLASPAASFINGQVIRINGGMSGPSKQ